MIKKIISGGQTGADQGGLFWARKNGLETGGTAPLNYRTEEGPAPWLRNYGLQMDGSWFYQPRTEKNVLNSDGTLIFGEPSSAGCRLTRSLCNQYHRPWYVYHWRAPNPISEADKKSFREWVEENGIRVLNVAGNRESTNPGVCEAVQRFLDSLL
jgi:hypothetical protein